MTIGNKIFDSCVGEIGVSAEVWDGEAEVCLAWKDLRLILGEKAVQDWRWRRSDGDR